MRHFLQGISPLKYFPPKSLIPFSVSQNECKFDNKSFCLTQSRYKDDEWALLMSALDQPLPSSYLHAQNGANEKCRRSHSKYLSDTCLVYMFLLFKINMKVVSYSVRLRYIYRVLWLMTLWCNIMGIFFCVIIFILYLKKIRLLIWNPFNQIFWI